MNHRALYVLNGLLLVVVGVMLPAMVGGGNQTAQASGGGPHLDNWMATILDKNEYLVVMRQDGSKIRVHLYQAGDRDYHSLLLREVRELDADFALDLPSAAELLREPKNQNYFTVRKRQMNDLYKPD